MRVWNGRLKARVHTELPGQSSPGSSRRIVGIHYRDDLYPEPDEFRPERIMDGSTLLYTWSRSAAASIAASAPRSLRSRCAWSSRRSSNTPSCAPPTVVLSAPGSATRPAAPNRGCRCRARAVRDQYPGPEQPHHTRCFRLPVPSERCTPRRPLLLARPPSAVPVSARIGIEASGQIILLGW